MKKWLAFLRNRATRPAYWILQFQRLKHYCSSSVERFLVTGFLSMLTIITVIIAVINYQQLSQQTAALFQVQLVDTAHLLDALTSSQLQQQNTQQLRNLLLQPDDATLEQLTSKQLPHHIDFYISANNALAYQIWNTDTNTLMVQSNNAPKISLDKGKDGFNQPIDAQGIPWHTYTLTDRQAHTRIIIAINDKYKSQVNMNGFIHGFSVILLLYVIVAMVTILIIRFSLTHLKKVAEDVQKRNPNSLSSIATKSAPQEALPLILAINQLFHRIQTAMQREKNFTADAAHELRTPLAALKMQVEVATRAQDEQQRSKTLRNLLSGANRCSHIVDQLLTLSRLEPESELKDPQPVDLKEVTQELLADLALLAVKKHISIELNAPNAPLMVSGNAIAIGILLRNLVDNAIRYSPANSIVQVILTSLGNTQELRVTDNGPGVSETDMPRLFNRFFRGEGNKETGSGLGLAIVEQIALLHHATISVQKPKDNSGLEVTVTFPTLNKSIE